MDNRPAAPKPTTAALMTIEELAAYLQVPKATLYRWRTKKEGPAGVRIGKHIRYRRRDVDEWLERQRIAQA